MLSLGLKLLNNDCKHCSSFGVGVFVSVLVRKIREQSSGKSDVV